MDEHFIHPRARLAGALAVVAGCVLALIAAAVIVITWSGSPTSSMGAAPIIRLDPVLVTISRERFDALRAEMEGPQLADCSRCRFEQP